MTRSFASIKRAHIVLFIALAWSSTTQGQAVFTAGLVGYYPFTGGSFKDFSGQQNDGEPDGDPTVVTGYDGQPSGALSFDGNDALSLGNIFSDYAKATLTAWVKVDGGNTSVSRGVISLPRASGGTGFRIGVMTRQPNVEFLGGSANLALFGADLTLNEWHFIAGTMDGQVVKLYLDGVCVASNEFQAAQKVSTTESAWIGKEFPSRRNDRFFVGEMDEVRIFNKGLSSAEIAMIYTGRPRLYMISSPIGGESVQVCNLLPGRTNLIQTTTDFTDTNGWSTLRAIVPDGTTTNLPIPSTPVENIQFYRAVVPE
ncbi:MAG: hypothetical protein ACI9TH_000553 [Kiritimatiellia bacterium]|jgi:hypothetical protein